MPDRTRELLLKAVRLLDEAEQDEVFGALLVGGMQPAAPAEVRVAIVPQPHASATRAGDRQALVEELTTTLGVASGDLRLLPVRLPAAQYDRLRAWSREHGFSMAVIIRTLVER